MTHVEKLIPPGKKYITKNDIKLIQPNRVTNARYKFNEIEENILIHIISSLQDFMTKDYPLQCDLFGSPIVKIDLTKTKYNKTEKRVYLRACKKFIQKTISFDWKNAKNKSIGTTATFITAFHNIRNTPYIELTLNEWAIPYLIYWGKGHTKFEKGIALTLKGVHTKRLYTLIKQWQTNRGNYGELTMDVSTLRKQFKLENKYTKIADFERYVLKPAQEKIKDAADVYFNYKLFKSEGSRSYDKITFLIHQNNKVLPPGRKTDMYKIVYVVVGWCWNPNLSSKAREVTDQLAEHPDQFFKVYTRFVKEYNAYQTNQKDLRDIIPLIKHILKEDYNII